MISAWVPLRPNFLLGSTLLLLCHYTAAQTGGPIGGPVGSPTGANGATGSTYYQGSRGALAAPSGNWSSGRAGRGTYEMDRRNQSYNSYRASGFNSRSSNVAIPGQAQPSAALQKKIRPGKDDAWPLAGNTKANTRHIRDTVKLPSFTQKVVRKDINPIEHYRDLVQQGMLSESGFSGKPDYDRAQSLYCEAARGGYPDAMVRLGWIYEEGKGVSRNHDIAATLFQRAAQFGSDIAQDLSQRYKTGKEILPGCVKGSVVEKGSAERSASVAELAALSKHTAFSRNPVAGAARTKIVNHVIAEAKNYKLDPRLVLAVMSTESAFNPNARSDRNAFGLMQILPETAERFGIKDIMDPVQNIRGGMAYLRWLLNYYRGDVSLVLAAYNAGEGAVDRYNGVPPYAETLAYVQRIRAAYPFDFHPYDPSATTSSGIFNRNPGKSSDTTVSSSQPASRGGHDG
ncbi:MAG: transglycosylase SLT domain-containing protein [Lautropia sp.]|nr:transglycosylase SLT domain-containing protein [Lautropia sp.]